MAYLRLLVNQDDDAAFIRIINTPRREIGSATLEIGTVSKKHCSLFEAILILSYCNSNSKSLYSLARFCGMGGQGCG